MYVIKIFRPYKQAHDILVKNILPARHSQTIIYGAKNVSPPHWYIFINQIKLIKMKNLNPTRLQNAEHLAFMSDLSVLLKEVELEPLNGLKAQLAEGVREEELSQKEIKKSEYTQRIIKLDEERDTIYQGLVFRLKSELCSIKEPVKTSAEKIKLVIDTYGNFVNHNYQKETTEIQNFLEELRLPQYNTAVKQTGLVDWIEWLDTANKKFLQAYTARRDEYASRTKLNTREIRINNDLLFKEIKKVVDAMEVLQPSDILTSFVSKIEASIDKWNETLSQRHNKVANNGDKDMEEIVEG